jgi:uncharacterized protein (DUF3820 family)
MKELQEMNLTSDLFSSVVFEDIPALQDVLRILCEIPDLNIIRVMPQKSLRNLYGHGVVLDVWAEDTAGRQYNIELQMSEDENHLKRSRYIQSVIDSKSFPPGKEYADLPELYLIFITEKDFLGIGTGITEILQVVKATGREFKDGVHKIYANLECPAESDDVNRLLTYIKDTTGQIKTDGFKNLERRVNYLKNDSGGKEYMCKTVERERREGREEGTFLHLIRVVLHMKSKGLGTAEISDLLGEDETDIKEIFDSAAISDSEDVQVVYDYMMDEYESIS